MNYHIGRIVLGSMCVGVSVWLVWSGIRVAGFSLKQVTSSWSFILQLPRLVYFLPQCVLLRIVKSLKMTYI